MPAAWDKIREIKEHFEQLLLRKANVVGVALGHKVTDGRETDEPCIVVLVKRKLPEGQLRPDDVVPRRLNNVSTDVVESGEIKALQLLNMRGKPRTARWRPAPGGVSMGHLDITAGTLGCLVERLGEVYILSNNHVLANANLGKIGDPVLQPACYSDDTEVLTDNGWKRFEELGTQDLIATLSSDGEIQYQAPTRFWKFHYSGKLIHWKGQMYDLLVTPEHNVFCRIYSRKGGKKTVGQGQNRWGLRKAGDLIKYEIEMKKSGSWNCQYAEYFELPSLPGVNRKPIGKIPMALWLKFLGWWLSEGSLCYNHGGYRICIRQVNKVYLKEIGRIIEEMGFRPFINKIGQAEFHSKQLFHYLRQFGHAGDKFIPKEFKQLPPNQLRILLTSLFKGDGSFVGSRVKPKIGYKEKYRGSFHSYTTKSKRLAGDVQELLLKIGLSGKVSYRKDRDLYVVGVANRNLTPRTTRPPQSVDYEGSVYDVTVPNHILMVRRNGNPIWSGNSYDGGQLSSDKIATLEAFVPIRFEGQGARARGAAAIARLLGPVLKAVGMEAEVRSIAKASFNRVDCAIARPLDPGDVSSEILEIGTPRGVGEARMGMAIRKSGRTTGLRSDRVRGLEGTVRVDYGEGREAVFRGQILAGPMSEGGDSGSAVLDDQANAVGLLFAGSNTTTVINPIKDVLQALSITLHTG